MKQHHWDKFTDKCTVCGLEKRKARLTKAIFKMPRGWEYFVNNTWTRVNPGCK